MPFHFLCVVLRVLCDRVVVGTEVVLQGVFMPFHAPHDRVAPPDIPHAGMVLRGLRLAHRVRELLARELLEDVLPDRPIVGSSILDRLLAKLERVLLELRVEGHPSHTHRLEDLVGSVLPGQFIVGYRVVS